MLKGTVCRAKMQAHLPSACIMPDSDGLMRCWKFVLPAGHESVLGLDERVQRPLAFCVHICIHASEPQHDQIPETPPETCPSAHRTGAYSLSDCQHEGTQAASCMHVQKPYAFCAHACMNSQVAAPLARFLTAKPKL